MADMDVRTTEDRLREEYFRLLPHIRTAAEALEAEVRYLLVPLSKNLESHERIVIKSRIKECESAISSLRRRRESWEFESNDRVACSLTSLNDLAGVRILAFPRQRVLDINGLIRDRFRDWVADPVPPVPGTANSLALKYHGYCSVHGRVRAELQLMSMLVGMYWEIEHATLYKPGERLRGLEISLRMQERNAEVIRALSAFEAQFEEISRITPPGAEHPTPH